MMVRAATETDIPALLALQDANLITNVSPEAQATGGFVTTPYTPDTMRRFFAAKTAFVAVDETGAVVGYAFAGAWDLYGEWAIFPFMVGRLLTLPAFHGTVITSGNSFQYGPVCVAESARGTGVPAALFAHVCAAFAPRFPMGVTFINKRNTRSLAAHQRKLDFEIIDEWDYGTESFYSLAFLTAP
ncbi:MAG: GNAT family acetyltransferase [Armatimonadetes bacterium]|nr:GNAT family acetyltransferase [Armatimonadota bacterium]